MKKFIQENGPLAALLTVAIMAALMVAIGMGNALSDAISDDPAPVDTSLVDAINRNTNAIKHAEYMNCVGLLDARVSADRAATVCAKMVDTSIGTLLMP